MTAILLINDDGIRSVGLVAAKNALSGIGRVSVVAPKRECSGIGKAMTFRYPINIRRDELSDGSMAYAIKGTPADAYLIATEILHRRPDLLVSGINLGPNLGIEDILNSGTLGAAIEGAIHGVPALAISLCMSQSQRGRASEADMGLVKDVLRVVAECVIKRGLPGNAQLLSINVPFSSSVAGISLMRPSMKGYEGTFVRKGRGYAMRDWNLDIYDDMEGTDVYAIKNKGYIAIAPLALDPISLPLEGGRELIDYIALSLGCNKE
jgi:5'-nucleotidase